MSPPATEPTPAERALLAAAGVVPERCYRTGTRVDVGQWLRWPRLWLAVTGSDWLLVAAGKRPFVEKIPVGELGKSLYNAVTGELILDPAPNARVRRLKLPPVEGRDLVRQLRP